MPFRHFLMVDLSIRRADQPVMAIASNPCACGSGLSAEHCCALDWASAGPAEGGASAIDQARAALSSGDATLAERLLIEGLEQAPTSLPALGLLYQLRVEQNRTPAAEALLRRIVRLDPEAPGPSIALALLLVRKGALDEAEPFARTAVRLAPNDPTAHNLMGVILTEARQPQAGERHYRRVLELVEKPNATLLASLAWNLQGQGRMEEARRLYRQAFELNPRLFNTLFGWARTEMADRQLARAGELFDAAEALAPGHPGVAVQRAILLSRAGDPEPALALLQSVQARVDPADQGLLIDILAEKGVLLDRLGRYPEAFEAYAAGKRAMKELTGQTYLAETAAEQARRLKAAFTRPRLAALPRATTRDEVAQPIFIVGFPRSGTTMIEQTLSAHPLISAGDELPVIGELVEQAQALTGAARPYPEGVTDLSGADGVAALNRLRDQYLRRAGDLGAIGPGVRWFTDKMPLNETHLGLISLVFPSSPVIHLIRHPLDVVLSTYANHMTHGFQCADDLHNIARHYLLTLDLVAHYRRETPLRYLPVRYEDVIDDQEGRVRQMLDFIGAGFDPRCLAFHENRRYARTASHAQVTEKLYDRSRYRWRHYRRELTPVVRLLAPAIRVLGYDLD